MRSIILLSLIATIAVADESPAKLVLKVTPNFGKASKADLLKVYESASSTIWRHCPSCKVPPVQIKHAKNGPISLFRRAPNGDIRVHLSATGLQWAQHAYQFAHETAHILCRYKEADMSNMWFEESICELASLYALRQMAKEWAVSPPYPNWKNYSKSLKSYADNIMTDPKHQLPDDVPFREWWQQQRDALTKNHVLRDKNTIIAIHLLPLLEENPASWEAFYYLNVGRTKEAKPFEDYLASWRTHCPERHRPFVDKVWTAFLGK